MTGIQTHPYSALVSHPVDDAPEFWELTTHCAALAAHVLQHWSHDSGVQILSVSSDRKDLTRKAQVVQENILIWKSKEVPGLALYKDITVLGFSSDDSLFKCQKLLFQ